MEIIETIETVCAGLFIGTVMLWFVFCFICGIFEKIF